ncbi:MAG TPA: U32 family peptidase, partial [Firmicutes bacterium]|nr:U32 family peptidase [Bacillota bacterium]
MAEIKRPEILAPAGSFEKMKFAFEYGADAVYAAVEGFSLRSFAGNFTLQEAERAVDYARGIKKNIYITVNVYPRSFEIKSLKKHLEFIARIKPDGIIISDLGVLSLARDYASKIPVHISVQANNVNYEQVKMWKKLGASRIILARELSIEEVKTIRKEVPDIELELFVHGAVCMSYSGRCLLSNYLTLRDANRGECTQPCRWKYTLEEEKRPGEHMSVFEDERGAYIFNSKDLCLIEKIPELAEAGIDSFKIEGRMKGIAYAASTSYAYKKALDDFLSGKPFDALLKDELDTISHREYTTGFVFDDGKLKESYESSDYISAARFAGYISGVSENNYRIESKHTIRVNDKIEIFTPRGKIFEAKVLSIKNSDSEDIT